MGRRTAATLRALSQAQGWLGCHRRAVEWFVAVQACLIIDNAKCAITKVCAQDPEVQRSYPDCAYGFPIDACPPHDLQKKGIVEPGVKYLKGNFLSLRRFRVLADLNAQSRRRVIEDTGMRRHGTTGEAPLARFGLGGSLLLPLHAVTPDLDNWSQATLQRDSHVKFERVPARHHGPWSASFNLFVWALGRKNTLEPLRICQQVEQRGRCAYVVKDLSQSFHGQRAGGAQTF